MGIAVGARAGNPPLSEVFNWAAHLVEEGELPLEYGRTEIVLMPVSPDMMQVFWEATSRDLRVARQTLASEDPQPIVRFYDVSDRADRVPSYFFDVEVNLGAKNWYVHLWTPGRSYFAELGLRSRKGDFFVLSRSNTVRTAAAWPVPRQPEQVREVEVAREIRVTPVPSQEPPEPTNAVERQLAAIYKDRWASRPKVSPLPMETVAVPQLRVDFSPGSASGTPDLTDLSEMAFVSGVSSSRP